LPTILAGVGFILALFACVVLHEFGHALTARRFGIKTRDITLLPIGGVARLERMPDNPIHELWVALAGPAVNLVIAAILILVLLAAGIAQPLSGLSLTGGTFLGRLVVANPLLGFNMIPASRWMAPRCGPVRSDGDMRATSCATLARVSPSVRLIVHNPPGLHRPLLDWRRSGVQYGPDAVRPEDSVSRAMIEFQALTPEDPLSHAIQLVLAGTQQDFPVVQNGSVAGVLTRGDMLRALAEGRLGSRVQDVMRGQFEVVDASEMLERASSRLQECDCHTLPITQDGRLVGLLTMENVGEFMMIKAALESGRRRG
jgi:CBS domain-containing protein